MRMTVEAWVGVGMVGLVLAGCDPGGGSGAAGMVGSTGGSVQAADGTRIAVPAGALAQAIEIVIAPNSSPGLPAGLVAVGPAYTFGPEGLAFEHPATVTLAFDPALLPPGKTARDLVIYTAPVDSTQFVALSETVVVDATHVSATTPHFSVFVAAISSPVIAADGGVDASRPPIDAQVVDARVVDARVMDGGVRDGAVRDGAVRDGAVDGGGG